MFFLGVMGKRIFLNILSSYGKTVCLIESICSLLYLLLTSKASGDVSKPSFYRLCFSYPAVCEFLQSNNLLSIIRAHEAQDAGYVLPTTCMRTHSTRKNKAIVSFIQK